MSTDSFDLNGVSSSPRTEYRICVSNRKVNCRACERKIEKGQLRVNVWKEGDHPTRCGNGVTHAECFITDGPGHSFLAVPDDLVNFDQLSDAHKDLVRSWARASKNAYTNSQGLDGISGNSDTKSSATSSQSSKHQARFMTSSSSFNDDPGPGPSTPSSASTSAAARPSPLRRTDSNSQRSQSRPGQASNPSSQSSWASQESNSSIIIVSDGEDEYDDDYDDYDDDDEDSEDLSGLEPEPAKRPRLDTDSQGNPLMPNLLAGVAIPDGPARSGDECSVCLDPPLHPVTLPCGHVFCFLCAKGLTRQDTARGSCSLCRQDIPVNFLDNSQVINEALDDVDKDQSQDSAQQQEMIWFYEGRNGWWRFEERNSEELEDLWKSGGQELETIICGQLYVINIGRMEQWQKNFPTRKRKIKRDLKSSCSKGVAGLMMNNCRSKKT